MAYSALFIAAFLVAFSCDLHVEDSSEYRVDVTYGRSSDGLPIQYLSFSVED